MTPRLYFFGRTPALSSFELSQFVASQKTIIDGIVLVDSDFVVDGHAVSDIAAISILGGTVKIAEYVAEVKDISATTLVSFLPTKEKKIVFGISGYGVGEKVIKQVTVEIKKLLESSQISARFLLPHEGSVISSVAVEKEHMVELVLVKKDDGYVVGKTTAVQPFESWNHRDYGRPYADAKLGMLPPKISRMAVNFALGADCRGKTLLDPFCGMGTILGEALLRGVNVIGSDIDQKVLEKAKKNISWLIRTYKLSTAARYYLADATHIADHIDAHSIDAIVTEPYLGSPAIGEGRITDPGQLRDAIKGLEKLYIGCLRNWKSILKPGGVLCIALPSFTVGGSVYSVKKVVDTCEIYGYTKILGPLIYSRPQAVVQRNFYLLKA